MPEMKSDEPEQGDNLPSPPGGDAYGDDGVDRTLIRWMLSLTPSERLDALTQFAESLRRIRRDQSSVDS